MDNNIIEATLSEIKGKQLLPTQYSALTLAYLGDCVYEMYVRSHLVRDANHKVSDLHKSATRYVRASAQAEFYHRIKEYLTEEEVSAFHRGRNAKSHPTKSADVMDYKLATGVEALLGHLYVKGDNARISELMSYLFI